MDVVSLPFSRLIGLESAPPESGFLLSLPASSNYHNHLGTVHAGALLVLAESASGEFLLRQFGPHPELIPVVRRLEAKFRKPAQGRVLARASVDPEDMAKLFPTLEAKGRAQIKVNVEVLDDQQEKVLSATVEWFVVRTNDAG